MTTKRKKEGGKIVKGILSKRVLCESKIVVNLYGNRLTLDYPLCYANPSLEPL